MEQRIKEKIVARIFNLHNNNDKTVRFFAELFVPLMVSEGRYVFINKEAENDPSYHVFLWREASKKFFGEDLFQSSQRDS